ncbi:MAG: glycolate oxidase subunit GlcF [Gammaproteobacteria bacterium]|nr:glycolate oxidase subunit GlcF [Gammaproteobacteria bacterium]
MQTKLLPDLLATPHGQEADRILRSCVHCGFCTATCPTYQLLGDELDGPRGRIYEIKLALEGERVSRRTQSHLDRCLTCLNCETTCPSGVQYHRLLDIGRSYVDEQVARPLPQKILRWLLRKILPHTRRVTALLKMGYALQPLMPAALARKLPAKQLPVSHQPAQHTRKMLLLAGCVQPAMTPRTNQATALVLNKLGIEVIEAAKATCCGALSHHLSATEEARGYMRKNIDAWWPHIEQGAEAIVITASGCGAMVKEYAHLLQHDPYYAEKATRVSALAKDLSEVLSEDDMRQLGHGKQRSIAFHPPCTLQHAQKLNGRVERLLLAAGYKLQPVTDSHLCCGSAGSYSILQPAIANQLKQRKLDNLQAGKPELIVTANIGCQLHLQSEAAVPVKHWIELFVDE